MNTLKAIQIIALELCFGCLNAGWIQAQAPAAGNRSTSFGPNTCGPADPAYIHSANETGGIPLFLQRSEAGKAFQLVRESTRSNVSTVFWGTGVLDGKTKLIEIPVDSVTQRLTFAFSTDTKGSSLVLKQPSGGTIAQNSSSTEITDLNCGRIVTLSTPETGSWRAEISGTGRFWLETQAQSDIHIIKAEFVRQGGRPGHEGFFPIAGQPVAGKAGRLEVSLSAKETQTTEFGLVDESGAGIGKVELHALNSDREFMDFAGKLELPAVPFRIAVSGRDSQGKTYQRFHPGLFHAETVEVAEVTRSEEVSAGETKQLTFTVQNTGAARNFKVTVADTRRLVSSASPFELTVGAGESEKVLVEVTVPPSMAAGTGDDVIVVATSTAGPPTSNSCVLHLSVR